MDIREEMLKYRAIHGISQKEFARRAKLAEQTVNSVENGLQRPSALTVAKIRLLTDTIKEDQK